MNKKVILLLATYQGAQFLREQLNSLIDQTWIHWELLARDDASEDATVQILLEFAAKDHRITVVQDAPGNLGCCANFGFLLELSLTMLPGYVMFCDQDDVWHPDKIEKTMAVMEQTEQRCAEMMPVLIHTDLQIVDKELTLIATSLEQNAKIKPHNSKPLNQLLVQNYIYGCTMMLNASLLKAVVPVPKEAEGHDYWVALVAASLGEIVYVPEQTILYRQHSSNVTGIKEGSLMNRLFRNFTKQGWSKTNKTVDHRINQAAALLKRLNSQTSPQNRALLADYLSAASRGGINAVITAKRYGIIRQGFIKTMVLYISLTRKHKDIDWMKVDHI